MRPLSPPSRWTLVSVLPFLSIGVGLALLLVDPLLAAVVAGLGLFVLTPLLAILFAFWPQAAESEAGAGGQSVETAADAEPVESVDADDDVEALRRRYTNGEMDEVEFERRLEEVLAGDTGDTTGDAGARRERDETPTELDGELE